MSYVETDIPSAFLQQLQTLSPLPPIAMQGEEYTPVAGVIYLAPHWMPAKPCTSGIGISAQNLQKGIYQISVMAPQNQGIGAALTLAGSLVELFKRDTQLSYGVVEGLMITSSGVGPQTNKGAWVQIPVSIYYRAFTSN